VGSIPIARSNFSGRPGNETLLHLFCSVDRLGVFGILGRMKSKQYKTVVFLGDGMADEPLEQLGGKTPLQVAATPGMDAIARAGRSGTLFTLPDAFPTSSDVANMSVLGCNLETEYCGRGALEAASQGLPLAPTDVAFRVNLITTEAGRLTDFSGGHLSQGDAETLIEALNAELATDTIRFYPGVSYRNLLVLSGPEFSTEIYTEKPDDNGGNPVAEHLPQATSEAGAQTAACLVSLMERAASILEAHPLTHAAKQAGRSPANGIWPWSGGRAASLQTLKEKYGISSAVISAVDVIKGLGALLGMDVLEVEGATGYIDTNYEGKAQAAIDALKTHDLVYLHVEAIDEVSHAQDLELKLKAIEDFDSRIVQPVLAAFPEDELTAVVLPDHPVPLRLGKHTRTPVPVSVRMPGEKPDNVSCYSEESCPHGDLGDLVGPDLMALLFRD
jgi:2,3-bisphosphoglycerate-independent phosphoglycerate mutase